MERVRNGIAKCLLEDPDDSAVGAHSIAQFRLIAVFKNIQSHRGHHLKYALHVARAKGSTLAKVFLSMVHVSVRKWSQSSRSLLAMLCGVQRSQGPNDD